MKLSPCKECLKRSVGCHSSCSPYINWKKEWGRVKALQEEERKKSLEYIRRRAAWERYEYRNKYKRRSGREGA